LTAQEARAVIAAFRAVREEYGRYRVQTELDRERSAKQYGEMLDLLYDLTNHSKCRSSRVKRRRAKQKAEELLEDYESSF
jgi:hypothetical protein